MKLDIVDVLFVLALVSICGGVWMIYPPAALIAFGLILLSLSALAAKLKAEAKRPAAIAPSAEARPIRKAS